MGLILSVTIMSPSSLMWIGLRATRAAAANFLLADTPLYLRPILARVLLRGWFVLLKRFERGISPALGHESKNYFDQTAGKTTARGAVGADFGHSSMRVLELGLEYGFRLRVY